MRVAAFPERIARELLEMYRYLKQNGFAIDRSRRTGYRQPVDSGSQAKIVQADTGIPARSGTTLGSATCTEFRITSGALATNTATLTVRNLSLFAIPANHYVLAHKESISRQWIAQATINGLRVNSTTLQYTIDGTTWVTWHTGTTCP